MGKTAVAGCFGSPLLSDLLGVGISFSSYTLSKGSLHARMTTQTKVAAGFALMSVLLHRRCIPSAQLSVPEVFCLHPLLPVRYIHACICGDRSIERANDCTMAS